MSSIESRRNTANGSESHRVRFRWQGRNRAVTFGTLAQAQSWRHVLDTLGAETALRLLDEDKAGPAGAPRTVLEQVMHYAEVQPGLTEGTRRRYRHIAEAVIGPAFSGVLVTDLTREGVSRWLNGQQRSAPKTVANRHALLSSALSMAVQEGALPANVAARIKTSSADHVPHEMVVLTPEEARQLLGMIPEHYRPLVALLVGTGLRFGEATALTARSMDRATSSARITQAWKATAGGPPTLGAPKSSRSRRTVAVPPPLFDLLRVDELGPDDFLVTTPKSGQPVSSASFHKYAWQPAARRFAAEVGKKPRVHDLRHSWATWAIQRGTPLPVVQRQLGHEKITTTVDTYGHVARSDFDPLLSMGAEILMPDVPALTERSG